MLYHCWLVWLRWLFCWCSSILISIKFQSLQCKPGRTPRLSFTGKKKLKIIIGRRPIHWSVFPTYCWWGWKLFEHMTEWLPWLASLTAIRSSEKMQHLTHIKIGGILYPPETAILVMRKLTPVGVCHLFTWPSVTSAERWTDTLVSASCLWWSPVSSTPWT